jgi:hypothetical protein
MERAILQSEGACKKLEIVLSHLSQGQNKPDGTRTVSVATAIL